MSLKRECHVMLYHCLLCDSFRKSETVGDEIKADAASMDDIDDPETGLKSQIKTTEEDFASCIESQ